MFIPIIRGKTDLDTTELEEYNDGHIYTLMFLNMAAYSVEDMVEVGYIKRGGNIILMVTKRNLRRRTIYWTRVPGLCARRLD